jgi:kinesin family member C1
VFSLRITGTRAACGQTQTLNGTLHLVDLAGSERLGKSHATGERLKETQAINKSLSALTDVFVALSKRAPHVPYRNSKLTFLLQPCLSGDGKALVIANLSPVADSAHESLCTLRFASMVGTCELGKVRAAAPPPYFPPFFYHFVGFRLAPPAGCGAVGFRLPPKCALCYSAPC